MEHIIKEFNKLSQSKGFDKCIFHVENFIKALEATKKSIILGMYLWSFTLFEDPRYLIKDLDSSNASSYINDLTSQLKILSLEVKEAEKEIHSSISKFGKNLDKLFKLDLSSAYTSKLFPLDSNEDLNNAVLMHLGRSGHFEIGTAFKNEAEVMVSGDYLSEFSIMYTIVQSLHDHNLQPAIDWAFSQRKQLLDRGSNLEFTLHKVQFINILKKENNVLKALSYAQKHLYFFGDHHLLDISRLMSSLLYYKNNAMSPYENLYKVPSCENLAWLFSAEFCSLIGLSPESPVYLAVIAGTLALPVLAKMDAVMKTKKAEWTSENELPTEIDLPQSLVFHHIFVCPVSKEQTTDLNPPKLLKCGHIIADQSLQSMKKDAVTGKLKCPYCPTTSSYSESRRVYF